MDEKKKLATAGQLEQSALGARTAAAQVAQAAAEDIAVLDRTKAGVGHTHTAAEVGAMPAIPGVSMVYDAASKTLTVKEAK